MKEGARKADNYSKKERKKDRKEYKPKERRNE